MRRCPSTSRAKCLQGIGPQRRDITARQRCTLGPLALWALLVMTAVLLWMSTSLWPSAMPSEPTAEDTVSPLVTPRPFTAPNDATAAAAHPRNLEVIVLKSFMKTSRRSDRPIGAIPNPPSLMSQVHVTTCCGMDQHVSGEFAAAHKSWLRCVDAVVHGSPHAEAVVKSLCPTMQAPPAVVGVLHGIGRLLEHIALNGDSYVLFVAEDFIGELMVQGLTPLLLYLNAASGDAVFSGDIVDRESNLTIIDGFSMTRRVAPVNQRTRRRWTDISHDDLDESGAVLAARRNGFPVEAGERPPCRWQSATPAVAPSLRREVSVPFGGLWGGPLKLVEASCNGALMTLIGGARPAEVEHYDATVLSSTLIGLFAAMAVGSRERTVGGIVSYPRIRLQNDDAREVHDTVVAPLQGLAASTDSAKNVATLRQLMFGLLASIDTPGQNGSIMANALLYWDPFCSCTGINIEAINFITTLDKILPTRAVAAQDCWCPGFPASDRAALTRLQNDQVTLPKRSSSFPEVSIWVSHKPVDFFPTFPYHGAINLESRPSYVIGRAMIESDRFNRNAVRILSDKSIVDELWVPAPFLIDVMYRSGVSKSTKIVVIPEAIDTTVYNPRRFPARAASSTPFRFLSNFKWEPRKGWDLLLQAYFTTFTAQDAVELTIKTYLYGEGNSRDVKAIERKITHFATNVLSLDQSRLPKINVIANEQPANEMPLLYASHDAFVLPSRGEGWGLPFQEAMSMGLPCIATSWSGMLGFMNHNNSLLIPIDGLENAIDNSHDFERSLGLRRAGEVYPPENSDVFDIDDNVEPASVTWNSKLKHLIGEVAPYIPLAHGAEEYDRPPRWARPNLDELKRAMLFVFDNREAAKDIGRRGRQFAERYLSREAVGQIVSKRIEAIVGEVKAKRDVKVVDVSSDA